MAIKSPEINFSPFHLPLHENQMQTLPKGITRVEYGLVRRWDQVAAHKNSKNHYGHGDKMEQKKRFQIDVAARRLGIPKDQEERAKAIEKIREELIQQGFPPWRSFGPTRNHGRKK